MHSIAHCNDENMIDQIEARKPSIFKVKYLYCAYTSDTTAQVLKSHRHFYGFVILPRYNVGITVIARGISHITYHILPVFNFDPPMHWDRSKNNTMPFHSILSE